MSDFGRDDPTWVDNVLDWPGTWLLARIAVVGIFLVSALLKIGDFPGAVAEQESHGLTPGALWAALTIGAQLIGALLVISGRFVWLGTGILGVFTAGAALVGHHFWTMTGVERFIAMNVFLEHIGLIGGLVMTALMAERRRRDR